MKVCLVTSHEINQAWSEKLDKICSNDLLVFSFNGLGLVSYKKELNGQTEYFSDLAKLSRQLSCTIVCGCDTDTYGVFRRSCVVADKGKILGVSDMVYSIDDSEFVPGGAVRVYETSAGRIGVIVSKDLFFPETIKTLALCDADLLCCVYKKIENFMPEILTRAWAFTSGISTCICAENYACVSDIRGNIVSKSTMDIVKTQVKIEKDYHLIKCKRRGFFKEDGLYKE